MFTAFAKLSDVLARLRIKRHLDRLHRREQRHAKAG